MNVVGALLPCVAVGCWDARMTANTMGAGASSPPPGLTDSPSPSNTTDQFAIAPVRERKNRKLTGFATLRKKLMRRRRSSKACDHGRVIREAVSDWSGLEVAALLEEYEALAALKDLSVQAELARPPAATFKQDLSTLFDFKYCTDVDLVFRGACFPVHRAILSARCPYFRDLLAGYPGYGARICLELRTPGVDIEMFSALLRYLYTGDLGGGGTKVDVGLLHRLSEEFGHPSPLEHDLRYLLETGDYADAALVFTSEGGSDYHRPDSGCSEYGFRPKLELPCHKAILSARSPFFRNLIQRRSRSGEEHTERALHIPTRIVLDESVIPKRYARVLLNAIYLDTVDLSLILRGSGCGSSSGSLGEVEALTVTGRARPSALEEAMELYQIGRFLELDIVSQGCEDAILEWLTIENLPVVLRWGSQPHGSSWVLRQARHLLREEFTSVAHSAMLHQLDKTDLADALASDFLQASELEVLQAVLKWGEHQLVKRMEDREPNVVSQTAHSVTRKGVKKRDLSDVELREILSELLPLVRMDHVIPTSSETLIQAIRRGLVSTPPSHMIGSDRGERLNAWVRSTNTGLFVRPRLFMPYYEEIKAQVEDQLVGEGELLRLRRARYIPDIPDTLYMVEEKPRSAPGIDIIAQAIPVPDTNTMSAMLKREQKLRSAPSCQRAIALPLSSRHEINRQLRLRVVREFNLPDAVAHLLESASCYRIEEDEDVLADARKGAVGHLGLANVGGALGNVGGAIGNVGGALGNVGGISSSGATLRAPPLAHVGCPRAMTFPRHQHNLLPAVVTEGDHLISPFRPQPWGPLERNGGEGGGQLSQVMPDVAMATAAMATAAMGDSSDSEEDGSQMGLDLGDGAAHTELSLPRHRRAYPPPPPPPHRFI